jgi:uncharacterized membrane protein
VTEVDRARPANDTVRSMTLLAVAALAASLALQLAFYSHGGRNALGDVPGRFFGDGVRFDALPYISAHVEYPVLIGAAMWIASLPGRTPLGFFFATCALTGAAGIALTRLTARRVGSRARYLLFAPPFVLYAFHNWDLLAVLAAIAGLCAFADGNDLGAGALLAVGAWTKVFPGLVMPALVMRRLVTRDYRGALRLVLSFAAVSAVINLPVALASPNGWMYALRFQSARAPTWGSLWFWVFHLRGLRPLVAGHRAAVGNFASLAALAIGLGIVVLMSVRIADPFALGAAAIACFMLTNKVYSPNYDLWLAAFLPFVPWPIELRRAFGVTSLLVWIAVFGHFRGFVPDPWGPRLLPIVVIARAVVVLGMAVFVLRPAPDAERRRRSRSWVPRAAAAASSWALPLPDR